MIIFDVFQKNIPKILLMLGFCMGLANTVVGQVAKYSNEFLSIGVGARGLGLAQVQTAWANDVTAGYWNPAGLLRVPKGGQASLMHAAYFSGIANLDYAAAAGRLKSNTSAIGFSLIRLGIDGIPDTRFLFTADGRLDYANVSSFSAADYAFFLSYAKELKGLKGWRLGANMKVIHRNAGTFANAWGVGTDLGLQIDKGKWAFGAVLRDLTTTYNVWSVNEEELADIFQQTGNDLPVQSTEVTLPSLHLDAGRQVAFGQSFKLLVGGGASFTFDGPRNVLVNAGRMAIAPRAAIELQAKNRVYIRTGVGNFQKVGGNIVAQPSFGVGLRFQGVAIDYALVAMSESVGRLYSHVLSLTFDLKKAKQ